MICLTGDVHHYTFGNEDGKHLKSSELQVASTYATIAAEYNVKSTLFLTGKAVNEEPNQAAKLLAMSNIELGGHNYHAFRPKWLYNGIFKRGLGLANGPGIYQDYEIRKTIHSFKRVLDTDIVSWRDHAYRRDRNTYALLAKNGIRFASDEVTPYLLNPYVEEDMTIVPVNIMPDHDHIYHGAITPEHAPNWTLSRDKFPPNLYSVDEWLGLVKTQIAEIVNDGGIATVLAHPACMEIADGFAAFTELCRFISCYDSVFMRELDGATDSAT